jgi:hypothetical protein
MKTVLIILESIICFLCAYVGFKISVLVGIAAGFVVMALSILMNYILFKK